ncbi:restriction endonuclease subunit S [Salinigranum marinum]|uniref:restriction endonuclease subunit S n=1 Tax=Salinigranum marinum TaxID=1515595 RepID=UPI002989B4BB|nr:restriction endonuclease subunit S [Salinigranum marinum]
MSEALEQSDLREGYKEVQLGPKPAKIPSEWTVRKLDELTNNSGNYGANISAIEYDPEKPRYIRITDIGDDGFLKDDDRKSIPRDDAEGYYLSAGDLLFARTGATAGKSYLCREDGTDAAYAGYLIRFELNESKVDTDFLALYVQSKLYRDWVDRITRHGAQQNINASEYRGFDILYPPLPEQRRIADILSTVDEQIQQTDEIIEETKDLKQGLIQDLVFFGKSHNGTQTVQLGPMTTEIAESWDVSTVGEITTKAQYGSSESLSTDGTYPVFRMNNIEDGKMVASPMKYSELDDNQAEKYRVEKGDILFNRTNSIDLVGKSGIFDLDGEYVFASYLIRLRTNDQMNPYFLNYYLNSHIGQGILFSIATRGASQANINATNLKGVKVPLPPREQQDRIVGQIQKVEEKIEQERETKQRLQELKRGLMQDLLTGKVRVNTAD